MSLTSYRAAPPRAGVAQTQICAGQMIRVGALYGGGYMDDL